MFLVSDPQSNPHRNPSLDFSVPMSIKLVSFESSCSVESYGDELIKVSLTIGMIEEALFLIEVCRVYLW